MANPLRPGPCCTIDAATGNGDLTGYLQNARTFLDSPIHRSTQEAVDQLLHTGSLFSGETDAHLVGHGKVAAISTGSGQRFTPDTMQVGRDNELLWDPIIAGLRAREFSSLWLWSCATGFGGSGTELLQDLADQSGAVCHGLNQILYCHAVTGFDLRTAKWNTARPGQPAPAPIPPEFPPPDLVDSPIRLYVAGQIQSVSPDDVNAVDVLPAARTSDRLAGDRDVFHAAALPTTTALSAFALSSPWVYGGAPSGIITGRVMLTYRTNGQDMTREFLVVNNEVLWDRTGPGVFYACTTLFAQLYPM